MGRRETGLRGVVGSPQASSHVPVSAAGRLGPDRSDGGGFNHPLVAAGCHGRGAGRSARSGAGRGGAARSAATVAGAAAVVLLRLLELAEPVADSRALLGLAAAAAAAGVAANGRRGAGRSAWSGAGRCTGSSADGRGHGGGTRGSARSGARRSARSGTRRRGSAAARRSAAAATTMTMTVEQAGVGAVQAGEANQRSGQPDEFHCSFSSASKTVGERELAQHGAEPVGRSTV